VNPASPPTFSLAGKIVVLTGGAGIYGRGLAAQIAATGATLILASRNVEALQKVSAEERALGRNVHVRPLNLTEEPSILQLRDSVLAEFGRVDGLINNAVFRPMKTPDAPLADWEASMQANATGLFAITRAFADTMGTQGSGSIVNIGSIQGMVGPDFSLYEGLNMNALPDYFFHKAGMLNLTRYFVAPWSPRRARELSLARRLLHRPASDLRRALHQGHVPAAHGRRARFGRAGHLPAERSRALRHGSKPGRRRRLHRALSRLHP